LTRLPSITTFSLKAGMNPSKVTLMREALKEYNIKPRIGAYRKMYTSTVAVRMRGERRCGFMRQ